MYSTFNNDMLAGMVKSNPELETVINAIIADNKKATSMLVHELRNPLSLLKGTVQYIEMKHPETREFKYWGQIQDLINDMEHIMADASLLNTFNYINKEDTNLIQLIENLINSFMPQASTKEINLILSVEPGSEAFFTSYSCDAVKIKQAFINLVKNAFEATNPGNFIHIDLRYLPGDSSLPSKLSIEISNNGQPIPSDALENIFVPFVTYKKSGTGVGLALVKKVIDMHYGYISVESNDALTKFSIRLPL
jgi:signal transduction histidine kinase